MVLPAYHMGVICVKGRTMNKSNRISFGFCHISLSCQTLLLNYKIQNFGCAPTFKEFPTQEIDQCQTEIEEKALVIQIS